MDASGTSKRARKSKDNSNQVDLPPGYTIGEGPDGLSFLVPTFMVSPLHHQFKSKEIKTALNAKNATIDAHDIGGIPNDVIGEGKIEFRADPGLSSWERLQLHAEVLALQEMLGLSYKDAAHRLYLGELERLKEIEESINSYHTIKSRIIETLARAGISNPVIADHASSQPAVPDADTPNLNK